MPTPPDGPPGNAPGGQPAVDFKAEALTLHSHGFSVIPLHPGAKRPLFDRWQKFGEVNPSTEQVHEWWDRHPDANIGIVTGQASNVIVLDVDGPIGQDSVSGRSMPITVRSKTRTGFHYFFQYPTHLAPVKNRVGLFPGVDIRADAGQVVAPPSVHPTGALYEWYDAPWEVEVAPAPGWLLDKLNEGGATGAPGKQRAKPGSGEFATLWEEALYVGVGSGRRNDALASLAGHFFSLGLPESEVFALVMNTNDAKFDPPLPVTEVEQVVMSISKSEQVQQWAVAATDPDAPQQEMPEGDDGDPARVRALAREAASQALGCRIEYAIKYDTNPPSFKLGVEGRSVILEKITHVTKESLFRDSFANGVGRLPKRVGNKRWDKIANALLASFEIQHVEEATDVGLLTGMLRDYLADYPPTDEIDVGSISSSHPLLVDNDVLINLNHLRVWAKTGWHVVYTINELGTLLKQQNFDPQQLSRRDGDRRATRNYWVVPSAFLEQDDYGEPTLEHELQEVFGGSRLN